MTTPRILLALCAATLATACAAPGGMSPPPASTGMGAAGATMPMTPMAPRMAAMKDMQQKMAAAKTPAERQALMADHMKAMQDGMAMMKTMHGGMQGMRGMGGMAGMDHGKGKPTEMSQRHQMMTDHMAMMQTMMDMMAQRMPAAPAAQ